MQGRSQQCGYNYYPISTTRAMLFNRLLWTQVGGRRVLQQCHGAHAVGPARPAPAASTPPLLAPYTAAG